MIKGTGSEGDCVISLELAIAIIKLLCFDVTGQLHSSSECQIHLNLPLLSWI
jgi:hypothetical protein